MENLNVKQLLKEIYFQLHPWNKLIKDQRPASNKVEKAGDKGKTPDKSKESDKADIAKDQDDDYDYDDDDDDDEHPKRMTKGPRSPTVRMLNEARLELEECIAELDARGRNNKETTSSASK